MLWDASVISSVMDKGEDLLVSMMPVLVIIGGIAILAALIDVLRRVAR